MQKWRDKLSSLMHVYHARAVSRLNPATAFISQPEPKTVGSHLRGRQIVAGNFLFSGVFIEGQGQSIWQVGSLYPNTAPELHGFAWMDDVLAVGDVKARLLAQDWVYQWIADYGAGRGAGWSPELTGRRLIRWISHGFVLLRGREKHETDAFFQSLARQAIFLSRRWHTARSGLARVEALSGMIYAGLSLEGMERFVDKAVLALARDCDLEIDRDGGLRSRNPEELLEILTYLIWIRDALEQSELEVPSAITDAMSRIVPVLRVLRHENGALARFHGGGRGLEGRLDYALSLSRIAPSLDPEPVAMGYLRMKGGRSSVIVDGAKPYPFGGVEPAHASTLAFELTSGRRPLIVNCGSGRPFGRRWQDVGRSTQGHSVLNLDGVSSSRYNASTGGGAQPFSHCPDLVRCVINPVYKGYRAELSHDGYQGEYGLTHARTLDLSPDGRSLVGEDMLTVLSADDRKVFDRHLLHRHDGGQPFSLRFHLHPDVDATLDMGGRAVSLVLKNGDVWIFRHDDFAQLSLDVSVYFEKGRLNPRETQQIVLSARTTSYITRVCWSFAKAQDTPQYAHDLIWNETAS